MRYVIVVVGLLAVIGGLAAIKYKQIAQLIGFGKQMQKMGPPPELVSAAPSVTQEWEGTLTAVGNIAPARGVTITNDAAGVVSAIRFDSGNLVKQGQVLVELDSSVERAQLASALARRDLANVNSDRSRSLFDKDAVTKSQLDTDLATQRSAAADVGALQAQIDRKTVRAPFAGKLGIRSVNMGQYLNPGTPLTVLESVDAVYVDFTVPQQRLSLLKVGMPVRVTSEGLAVSVEGTLAAVDPTLDSATRSVKVRAALGNQDEKLHPGMFVTVTVVLPERPTLVAAPATAVVHAPYGDSVFVVEDKKDAEGHPVPGMDGKPAKIARQQFVRLGESRGDYVAILDGVTAGQELVTAGAFKLRNGATVIINNSVKQDFQLAPRPENR